MLTVSIIIVNWNTKDLLNDCLLSLKGTAFDIPHEVIVIDNASGDGSTTFINKNFPNVILIKNSMNKGFAAACNQGALQSKGKYLFLLNPDTLAQKDSLRKLIEFADKQKWMGAAGPQLIGRDGRTQNSVRRFPQITDVLVRDTVIKRIIPGAKRRNLVNNLSQERPSSVEQISGAAFLIRKDLWRDIGGMDERFFMFYEEVDLCKRLKDLGYNIYYLPASRIIHRGGGSRKQDRSAAFSYSVKSMFLYIKKYESPAKLFLFKIIYKPLFLLDLLITIGSKAKREFLKKCLIEFLGY